MGYKISIYVSILVVTDVTFLLRAMKEKVYVVKLTM